MPNRKSSERNVRSLTKSGHGGFSITLPIDLIRALGWRSRQKVTVAPKGRKLIVKDWKK